MAEPCPRLAPQACYRPRKVRSTPLWKIMDGWWRRFLSEYDERFEPRYGALRHVVRRAGERFLRCGIIDFGFARIRCDDCGAERLLAFSCKTRLCPSCAKKRQLLFGDFLAREVIEDVSHRHLVFSLPRRLRLHVHHNRRLLSGISRCAYAAVLEVLRHGAGEPRWVGAAVHVIHTWGDLLDFHPHIHALVAWGLFDDRGGFHGALPIPAEAIRDIFMHKVFKLMLREGVITEDIVADMRSWPHSGFHVWVGPLVSCLDARSMENMSQYTARGPISLEKLDLVPGAQDKGGTLELEWPEDASPSAAPSRRRRAPSCSRSPASTACARSTRATTPSPSKLGACSRRCSAPPREWTASSR